MTEGHSSLVMVCLTNDTGIFTQWFFNNEILLPSETRLLSTDNRTLTLQPVSSADAGDYQCEISNPVSSSKSSHLRLQMTPGGSTTGISVGAIISFIVVALVGLALAAVLGYFLFLRRSSGWCDPREHQPGESSAGPSVHGSSASQIPRPTQSPAVPIYEDLLTPDSSLYCRVTPKPDTAP